MKKLFIKRTSLILAIAFMAVLVAMPVLAGTEFSVDYKEVVTQDFSQEDPYFYAWSEDQMDYIQYDNPNYPKANPSLDKPASMARSTELGITKARTSYNVYTTTSTSGGKVGSIGSSKSREIVRVTSETTVNGTKWYYITYKTSGGTKSGYIQATNIDIPSRNYTYSKACTSGTWTQDYGYNNHTGVDIGGTFSVYAYTGGTVTYKYAKFNHPDDNKDYLISYGNFAQQSPSLGTTTYAHLSSFSGFTASTLPSKQLSTSSSIVQNNLSRYSVVTVGSKSISSGGSIGTSGNTGNSTGAHLHFEVSGKDPFKYVLFPDYGYVL